MKSFIKQSLLPACALAAVLALSACGGGGGDSTPQPVAQQPAAQTISFAAPGEQRVGVLTETLQASATSNLTVSLASTTPSVCTVDGTTLALTGTGTCTVSATQTGNAQFAAAEPVLVSFAVAPGPQTISFISPGTQTFGPERSALVATATSGLPVSFESTTPAVCIVDGSELVLCSPGTCVIVASQSGDAMFAAAPTVSQEFSVVTAGITAQTISFASPGNQSLGTAPLALAATSTSGLPVDFASTTPGVCSVSGGTLTLDGVGTCTVIASQAGNATYGAAPNVSNSFNVTSSAQVITFAAPTTQTFGVAPLALVATASSGLPVSFSSTTPGVCNASGTALALTNAGTCTVTASQAGNASVGAAAPVSRSFTVAPASQSIVFSSPGGQTLGTTPPALSATSTSGLAVSFESSTTGVCTVSGTTLSLVAAGSCTVVANQAGNANYVAAATVSQTFNVTTAALTAQTITFASPGNQTLGTTPPALAATASSGLAVSFTSSTPGTCNVSGTTLTLAAVGTCTVSASQSGNATFAAAAVVSNSFTIAAAPLTAQTITFATPASQTAGTTLALVATSTSGLTVSFASMTSSVCTASGTTLTLAAAGTCTVQASQAGNSTFAAAPVVSQSFTVVAAAPTTRNAFANGGFEAAANGAGEFADGWRTLNGVTRSSADARSGSFAALIAIPDPGFAGQGLFQNSVDHGGLAVVAPANWGTSPTLTFWIKGNSSETGNLNYALRYLDSNGVILNTGSSQARTIWTGNTVRQWSQIALAGIAIPANTTAVFLEMTLAVGPTGTQPPGNCGVDNGTGLPLPCNYGQAAVFLDDVNLQLLP